jgi:hypothetical protein
MVFWRHFSAGSLSPHSELRTQNSELRPSAETPTPAVFFAASRLERQPYELHTPSTFNTRHYTWHNTFNTKHRFKW